MCGRLTLTTAPDVIAAVFGLAAVPSLRPRYNLAPTQTVVVVRSIGEPPARRLDELRWGLIPSWAKDPAVGGRMINARAETVAEKPAYRVALRRRRCLVVADGFYEWQRTGSGKQPYLLRARDRLPFALAGIWEVWSDPRGENLTSCSIITTTANATLAPLHDRMPVILPAAAQSRWLEPEIDDAGSLVELLVPCPEDVLTTTPVSRYVNDARHDDARCFDPA